jgi:hypothetical protein
MEDVLKKLAEWLESLGLPDVLNIVLLIVLVGLYLWFQHRLKRAEINASANAKFLETRLKERYEFMKEFYHWLEEFNHSVEHISKGDRAVYEGRLVEFRQKLREGARNSVLHGGPAFPDLVKEFTDIGSSVREHWEWEPYIDAKNRVHERLEEIAKTLPR